MYCPVCPRLLTAATSSGALGHLHFRPAGYKFGGPRGTVNSLGQLTEFRKCYAYNWSFIRAKGTNQNQPKEEMPPAEAWAWECSKHSTSCLHGHSVWQSTQNCHPRKLTLALGSRTFIEVYYVGMIELLPVWLNSVSSLFLLRGQLVSCGPKSNSLITWLVFGCSQPAP